jgi:hypothetical protein
VRVEFAALDHVIEEHVNQPDRGLKLANVIERRILGLLEQLSGFETKPRRRHEPIIGCAGGGATSSAIVPSADAP